jgi:aromatic ring-opening dioxygenase LigB subunit
VSLVFACIAPHGDVDLAPPELRPAMEGLGRFAAAAPDVAVVVTPHSVHVDGHFAVVTAGKVGEWETDAGTGAALVEAPLPILGVSYGGNGLATAEFPLDSGAEVPLEFLRVPRIQTAA